MQYDKNLLDSLKSAVIPIVDSSGYESIIDLIGDAQIVLLGEATHGSHQFYAMRSEITKRLITEKNFNIITLEADWPDAYQLNEYIVHKKYTKATQALAAFDKFPTWMWRNVPMLELIDWLYAYNQNQKSDDKIFFYGLDIYSLYRSIDTVIVCLEKIDPQAAAEARHYYSCFDHFRSDPQMYGYAVFKKIAESCSYEVTEQLKRVLQQDWYNFAHDPVAAHETFNIEQNARVIKNAENYYRSLFIQEKNSWNLRDSHMFETVQAIIKDYELRGIASPKIIIWAHNSHIGNAESTEMYDRGEYNIGQLIKKKYKQQAVSIGFTTYHGTVSAASDWHEPVERKIVQNALPASYEALFHALNIPTFFLPLTNKDIVPSGLLERAIGVIYRPETERQSHYFSADLAYQFDAIIHCDKTTAVEPLEKTSRWTGGEVPETYPSGI